MEGTSKNLLELRRFPLAAFDLRFCRIKASGGANVDALMRIFLLQEEGTIAEPFVRDFPAGIALG